MGRPPRADIVPIEGDIEPPDRHLAARGLANGTGEAVGQRDATGVDAYQHQGAAIPLENLRRHPGDGSRHRRLIQDFMQSGAAGLFGSHLTPTSSYKKAPRSGSELADF